MFNFIYSILSKMQKAFSFSLWYLYLAVYKNNASLYSLKCVCVCVGALALGVVHV